MGRICHRCGYRPPPGDAGPRCPADGLHLVEEEEHARAPRDAFLGTTLGGRYPILGTLGQGGMGAVYRSVQPHVQREVAVKVVLPERTATDEDAGRRFLREARAVAALDDPGIVTLYDFGIEDDGTLFMVLELVQGRPLTNYYAEGALSWRQVVSVGLSVLDALNVAHQHEIVHRDLKPDNVMLLEPPPVDGTPGRLKLLDFGLAVSTQGELSRITAAGLVGGTPAYMAPEQAAGGDVDRRADLYTLGIILYEGLAGRLPYRATSPSQLLLAHVSEAPLPFEPELGVPEPLAAAVLRCLEKPPEDRFQDAASLWHELRRVGWPAEAAGAPVTRPVQLPPADLVAASPYEPTASTEAIALDEPADGGGDGRPAGASDVRPVDASEPAAPAGEPSLGAPSEAPDWLVSQDRGAAHASAAVLSAAPAPDGPLLEVDRRASRYHARQAPAELLPGPSASRRGAARWLSSFRWRWLLLLPLLLASWKLGPPLVETARIRWVLWRCAAGVEPDTGRLRVRFDVEKRLTESGFDPAELGLEVAVQYTDELHLSDVTLGADYERHVTWPGVRYTTVLRFQPSVGRHLEPDEP